MERHAYLLGGQVQGVGFRPFVYRTATGLGLSGFVGNTSDGVRVEVQGRGEALALFAEALCHGLPPLARITERRFFSLPVVEGEAAFCIAQSEGHSGHTVLVSPDVATCDACLADMNDPAGRRHGYAFTNCTDCGPRYTITRSIPYDRATTTMACFPLCPDCQAEYEDPLNRRFHAQPNACPVCGPRLWFVEAGGEETAPEPGRKLAPVLVQEQAQEQAMAGGDDAAALARAAAVLARGGLVAVKGLGGFLLACDAHNAVAIAELRRRKRRPHKSLAVMVPDVGVARRLAWLRPEEEALLLGPERPVLIARRRSPADCAAAACEPEDVLPEDALPDDIAPDLDSVGIMLPYTPLHHLLLAAFAKAVSAKDRAAPALVMTSGNAGGEPIALGNREALQRLSGIADAFLLHNRDILIRADDSVLRLLPGVSGDTPMPQFFRRARGYVPRPVQLPPLAGGQGPSERGAPQVLAVGAELKSTLCFTRGSQAFVSQHIGDLSNEETFAFFRETAAHLAGLLEVTPQVVVRDAHPDYLSSVFAEACGAERKLPVLCLQHHFAHIYSVLAEHGHEGPALGLALDGTGLGDDGSVWGGELLFVRPDAVNGGSPSPGVRLGRLSPFPLPGGDMAAREPWRLVSAFFALLGEPEPEPADVAFVPSGREAAHAAVTELVRREMARVASPNSAPNGGPNAGLYGGPGGRSLMPWTSSCGRLFDAVAAMLGLCRTISYEGQAAIRLERAQGNGLAYADSSGARGAVFIPSIHRPGAGRDLLELDTRELFLHLLRLRRAARPVPEIARCFHNSLVEGLADMTALAAQRVGVRTVALSGGALQNATLAGCLPAALLKRGLLPLRPLALPPGDGGLCLGQAFWARRVTA